MTVTRKQVIPGKDAALCSLGQSEKVAAAFLSLPEDHSDNRNGILKRASWINGAVIKQMRSISEIAA